jgi:mRNA interferase RelE/StbE
MGSYSIVFNESANHELSAIDRQFVPRIVTVIEALAEDPFPPGHRKLRGREVHELYRIRVGRYRVIYSIDPLEQLITIYRVRAKKGKKTYKNI